ncbi:MAG: C-terminal binding protein [Spirochaetales bacterium]|uniref:C-terminal binding protein n=1 Tax=Candidatus Thalassospirochaeta sargassi TaxID=3119039 RepID=A0AAJ1IEC2_9SPIO|nr:C-terminal binding protein [Spirochaetales bacterium]
MSDYKVVILDHRYDHYDYETEVLGELGIKPLVAFPESEAAARELLHDADGVMCNLYQMDASVINMLDKCRVISRYGVGYDNVDVDAAAAKGIAVCNVPDYSMEDASDHALALLFNCTRKISYKDRKIRDGQWNLHNDQPCFRMTGRTLGVIGFGHIGSTLVRKISGFGFAEILIDSPNTEPALIGVAGGRKTDLDEVLRRSDYISIHCPLKEDTVNMFDDRAFAKMKDGSILINTARGPIVNERALCRALESGKLAAAGIDVYDEEPLSADSPLRRLENVTLTDHAAWYSEESIIELKTKAARNVVEVLSGKEPQYKVN